MADAGHGSAPSGGSPRPEALQHRLLLLAVVLLIAFGLAVPAVVLISNGTSKASDGPGGMHLTKEETAGRELFATTCVYCHALAASKSYGRTGPDLDVVINKLDKTERQTFVEGAIKEGENHGIGQMPALLFQGKEAKEVAEYVAAVAGVGLKADTVEPAGYPELANKAEGEAAIAEARAENERQATPAELSKGKTIFETYCSGCHTLAAAKATGTIGPDLDRLEPGYTRVMAQVETGSAPPEGIMPAFGKQGVLSKEEVEAVARYVSTVAGTK